MAPIEEMSESSLRIVREHAEQHARMTQLYNDVAAHLPGWTAEIVETDEKFWWGNSYRYKLVDGAGHAISLGIQRGHGDKLHVSGYWPSKEPDSPYSSPSDVREETPSINVALARGFEAIGREITRRFLPEYLRIFGLLEAKHAADRAYRNRNRKAENWQRIVDAKLVRDPRIRDGQFVGDASVLDNEGSTDFTNGYGRVRMTGEDSLEINLSSLPVETAMRVLRALSNIGQEGGN